MKPEDAALYSVWTTQTACNWRWENCMMPEFDEAAYEVY